MRGTGKTTLGKQLAEALGWPFVDLDREIERISNKKIVQLVEEEGWETFRAIEKKAVEHAAALDCTVISTGGGTLMDHDNTATLKENGHVILLTCDLAQLIKNLEASHARPALTRGKTALEEVAEVWESRKARYHEVADTVHDTSDWPPIESLIKKLRTVPGLLA